MSQSENDHETIQIICNQDEIVRTVKAVTDHHQAGQFATERRSLARLPYPKLVELLPFETDLEKHLAPIHVVGKHLSERGFDFLHTEAITMKHGLVRFPWKDGEEVQFVIKVDWCRFLETGWYESGGRFTKVIKRVESSQLSVAGV